MVGAQVRNCALENTHLGVRVMQSYCMAEKRTRAEKLLLNIERLDRRDEARFEFEVSDNFSEVVALNSRASVPAPARPELSKTLHHPSCTPAPVSCTTLKELTLAASGVESYPNSPQSRGGEMKRTAEKTDSRGPIPHDPDLTDRISQRAYELFEARGCEHGHDREDWLQAEAEILASLEVSSSTQEPEPAERHAATAA